MYYKQKIQSKSILEDIITERDDYANKQHKNVLEIELIVAELRNTIIKERRTLRDGTKILYETKEEIILLNLKQDFIILN